MMKTISSIASGLFATARRTSIAVRAALTAAAVLTTVMIAVPATQAQNATPAPAGSYRASCQNIQYYGDVLTAICSMGTSSGGTLLFDGITDSKDAALATKNCLSSSDIWNQFGDLYCTAKLGVASGHALPPGSYVQWCTAMNVEGGVLYANCASMSDFTRDNSLKLSLCNLDAGIDNNDGQLLCVPATAQSTAKTQQSVATLTAPPPSPAQVALKSAGCNWFLGRANQYLCQSHAAFNKCVGYVAKGQVKSCMAPNEIHSDCRHFLGRTNEFLCLSRVAFQQCESYRAKGTLGVKACLNGTPKS